MKFSFERFDPTGDKKLFGKEGVRGGKPYKQPPKGYIRKGVKVIGMHDNENDDWLGEEGWPVAYFGVRGNSS